MPAGGEWIDLPPEVEKPILPPLPRGRKWPTHTRELWKSWRQDPATTQFTAADIGYALETIRLHADGTKPDEIRLRMDGLGLTAKGKRNLRWRIREPGEVVGLDDARAARSNARRGRLAAVDPESGP